MNDKNCWLVQSICMMQAMQRIRGRHHNLNKFSKPVETIFNARKSTLRAKITPENPTLQLNMNWGVINMANA